MSVTTEEQIEGKVLTVHVSGKLSREDYRTFVPEADRMIEKYGKIRVLFDRAAVWTPPTPSFVIMSASLMANGDSASG